MHFSENILRADVVAKKMLELTVGADRTTIEEMESGDSVAKDNISRSVNHPRSVRDLAVDSNQPLK